MENITVDKETLLEKMRDNRDHHRLQFLKAQDKYRDAVIKALDERLQQARNGGPLNLGFTLPEPRNYTDEYDAAIAMVEWDQGDVIVLSQQDFERFVLNQWEWARAFKMSTQSYLDS